MNFATKLIKNSVSLFEKKRAVIQQIAFSAILKFFDANCICAELCIAFYANLHKVRGCLLRVLEFVDILRLMKEIC